MLLKENITDFIKSKIKSKDYSDKNNVQYVLELLTIEDYVRTGKVNVYFQGFTIDFLKDKYFDEYIEIVKELKSNDEYKNTKNNHKLKDKYLSNGINFSNTKDYNDNYNIWLKLGGK